MKGFLWKASSHDLIGYISVAGNVARLESPGTWACLDEKAYTSTDAEKAKLRKHWDDDGGWATGGRSWCSLGKDSSTRKFNSFLILVSWTIVKWEWVWMALNLFECRRMSNASNAGYRNNDEYVAGREANHWQSCQPMLRNHI